MAPSAASASNGPVPLAGSDEPAAARANPSGAVPANSVVDFLLTLRLRDQAGAEALEQAVTTPGNPSYRHYLTAAQWEARFSPTAAQVAAAENWLRSSGFTVGSVSADRMTISASGTAAQVEKAFGTGLAYYKVHGQNVRLTTSALSVPASLSGVVLGTLGIDQNVATPAVVSAINPPNYPPAPPAFVLAGPCGGYYGQRNTTTKPPFGNGYPTTDPDAVCGYTPPQLRSAYGLGATTGKGVTVAIVDAYGSATIAGDAANYATRNDPGHPFSNAHFSQILSLPFDQQSLCQASGWLDEQAIDVEAVHATAPDANILYVGAQDCINGLFNAEQNVIDNSLANIVTNSWGDLGGDLFDSPTTRQAWDDLWLMADSTSMSILFSSGDSGDDFGTLGVSTADYPPSSPLVTAVGGTSLQVGASGQRTGELGWATGRSFLCTPNLVGNFPGCTSSTKGTWLPVSYDGGSGGFTSYNYAQPSYQAKVVPVALSERNAPILGPTPMRVEPDISLDADPATGFLIGLHETFANGSVAYGETRYGGTSLASPLLAGILADADQAAAAAGQPAVGFINPAIYRLERAPGAIYDIKPGGKQGQVRYDLASNYAAATGKAESFRELTYEGDLTYCDATGNCATRPNTLSTAAGFDSMTGLGSPGANFVADLARGSTPAS